jgi:hypothetical protein
MFIWHEHAHNPAHSAASFRLVLSGIAKGRGPGCSLMDSLIRKSGEKAVVDRPWQLLTLLQPSLHLPCEHRDGEPRGCREDEGPLGRCHDH